MQYYLYMIGLLIGFYWTFSSLRATNLSSMFKANHIWQIRSIYTILSLAGGHVLGSIIMNAYLLIITGLQR